MVSWRKIRLGDICEIERGGSPRPIKDYITNRDDGVNWIKIGDTSSNSMYITSTKEKIIPEGVSKSRFVKSGDFLLTNSMSFGRPYILKVDGCIHDGWLVIRDEKNFFNKQFLYYLLSSDYMYSILKNMAVGGVVNNLNSQMVRNLELNVPTIDIQDKIAVVLKKAQELIDKRKEQISALDELVKSRFIEMFGDPVLNPKEWKVIKLGEISSVGSSKRVFVEELVNEGVPFYRGTEIGTLSTGEKIEPTLFITKEHYNKLKNSTGVPAIGDLLMPSICPDGRIWCVDTGLPFYFKDGRVLWIHLENQTIDSMFLKHMLREKFNRDYNKIASGTTFAELKIFALKDLGIIMPPIGLQNQFADFVNQVDKLKFEMKQSLKELENNFNSLMQSAFNGKLFN